MDHRPSVLFALIATAASMFQPEARVRTTVDTPLAGNGRKGNCVARDKRASRKAKNIKRHRRACRG